MKNIISIFKNKTKGILKSNFPLSNLTWFNVGGCAEFFYIPFDLQDLQNFLKLLPNEIPVTYLGAGSNILIRDGGIEGVVIKLKEPLNKIQINGNKIKAFAGVHDSELTRFATKNLKSGLEFLIGIPGTVGGGIRMNAGCAGKEFKDVILYAEGFNRDGKIFKLSPNDMGMTYRKNKLPDDWIFTSATFVTKNDCQINIKNKVKKNLLNRISSQPKGVKTGGSTFKNPKDIKAWELIDKAGCRNLKNGKARVSSKHCNFIINEGGATATEIEDLGEIIRKKVLKTSGIELAWEIKKIGKR